MYSHHGASARGISGKRGHGGRSYRPPPDKKDNSTTPPPLKECNCLLELDIEEYLQPQPTGRTHVSLGGRTNIRNIQKHIRSMQCHVEIPGRSKGGPVGIVGHDVTKVICAAEYFLNELITASHDDDDDDPTVNGRLHLNVKQGDAVIAGRWNKGADGDTTADAWWWLFQSSPSSNHDWSVVACRLKQANASDGTTDAAGDNINHASSSSTNSQQDNNHGESLEWEQLQMIWDNFEFQHGQQQSQSLQVFVNDPLCTRAFCVGNKSILQQLLQQLQHDGIATQSHN